MKAEVAILCRTVGGGVETKLYKTEEERTDLLQSRAGE